MQLAAVLNLPSMGKCDHGARGKKQEAVLERGGEDGKGVSRKITTL